LFSWVLESGKSSLSTKGAQKNRPRCRREPAVYWIAAAANRVAEIGYDARTRFLLQEVGVTTPYETDVVAWASEQAMLIRAGRFDLLDREHIAEEIEDVGKSEQRELASRMAVLLAHLLKWQYQSERRGASWEVTIKSQRHRIKRRLGKTPSLRGCLNDPDWWEDAWGDACETASAETGLGMDKFPNDCPWGVDAEILNEGWLPD
jgi:hypothetical protein